MLLGRRQYDGSLSIRGRRRKRRVRERPSFRMPWPRAWSKGVNFSPGKPIHHADITEVELVLRGRAACAVGGKGRAAWEQVSEGAVGGYRVLEVMGKVAVEQAQRPFYLVYRGQIAVVEYLMEIELTSEFCRSPSAQVRQDPAAEEVGGAPPHFSNTGPVQGEVEASVLPRRMDLVEECRHP